MYLNTIFNTRENNLSTWMFVTKHFLLSKLVIVSVMYFTLLISFPVTNEAIALFSMEKFLRVYEIIFSTGDTGWYQGIAQNGYAHEIYSTNIKEQKNWAYFPLFPIILSFIHNDFIIWFLLQVAILGSGFMIYKIAESHFPKDIALWSVLFYLYWPWTYMQSSLRPEAFLLLFWLVSYFTFTKKYYSISALFAFLSALLKPNGFLISFLACLYVIKIFREDHNFKMKNYIKPFLVIIAGPLGVIFYSIYIYNITGDYLSWAKIQSTWGSFFLVQPLQQVVQLFSSPMFIDRWGWDPTFFNFLTFLLTIFVLFHLRHHSLLLAIFGFAVLSLSFLNFGVWVLGRHLTTVFPIFIGLSLLVQREKYRYLILNIFLILITMMSIFSALGINAFKA